MIFVLPIITEICGMLLLLISITIDLSRIVLISGTNLLHSLISGNILGNLLGGLSELINIVLLSMLELVHFTLSILSKLSTKPMVSTSSSVPNNGVSKNSIGISDKVNWHLLNVIAMVILLLLINFIIKIKMSQKVKREKETLYSISQDGNWNLGGSKRRVLP